MGNTFSIAKIQQILLSGTTTKILMQEYIPFLKWI